jgi:hypothetical protein
VKTTAEWAESGLVLLRGQFAVETGGDGKFLYILSGDGNPANADVSGSGGDNPHARLRIASAKAQEELKDHTDQTEGAHNIPGQIDGKISVHSASPNAHSDIRNAALADNGAEAALVAAGTYTVANALQKMRDNLKSLFSKAADALEKAESARTAATGANTALGTHKDETSQAHGIPAQINTHNTSGSAHSDIRNAALADNGANAELVAAGTYTVANALQKMRDNLKSLFSKADDAQTAAADANTALGAHKNETITVHGIPAQIDGKITEHKADQNVHGIPGQIEAKITEHNADGNENAHTDMRVDIIDLDEKKAPKENPVFSGTVNMEGAVAEVAQPRDYRAEGKPAPYGNPAQPATVKDFTDVFNVSVQTAGGLLREYDHDGPPDFFKFLKTVDVDRAHECFKDGEEAAFREVDYYHANYADYLTQKDRDAMARDLRTLEELLMSLSGEKLRVADRESGMEGFVQRCVDRAWGAEEARMTDARVAGEGGIYAGIYDDAKWV